MFPAHLSETSLIFWLKERLSDLVLWPVNLVRDFPVRFGRFVTTLRQGLHTIIFFIPLVFQQQIDFQKVPGKVASWIHCLLIQSFDLVGGPEVCQFLMHLITYTSPLTDEEIQAISLVLGPNAMRYKEVRVASGGLFEWVFRINGNLAFATWHTVNFPRNGRSTRANLPILVHELIHVYQYEQVGSRYLGEAIYALITTNRQCYDYGSVQGLQKAAMKGQKFCHYNREQQAQIGQDYFVLWQKGEDVVAVYEPFISQLRKGDI